VSKRIFILYTGGTIGMRSTPDGYVPEGGLQELITAMLPTFPGAQMPEYQVHECSRLIDSANIEPADWSDIAREIAERYQAFDGFVVLHGTDTMAYTASALPFVFRGLGKPIIVTGSQIPLRELRNDARNNLLTAMLLAAHHPVPEVSLYFNGRLIRGNRVSKVEAEGFDAFASPNYPLLGEVGINIEINHKAVLAGDGRESFELVPYGRCRVAVLRLFPGIDARFLRAVLSTPVAGLVLQCYGVGNAPVEQPGFLDELAAADARGVVVVDVSQCAEGRVDLGKYAAGSALLGAGVVSGFDMTVEAAFTKLNHLLARELAPTEVKAAMQQNLCGELTPPDTAA